MSAADLRLRRNRAGLLIIDIQEKLAGVMKKSVVEEVTGNLLILVETARRLGLPVVVSQQYPKGLGQTVPAVADAVAPLTGKLHRFDKVEFSVCAAAGFSEATSGLNCDQWIVTGMETHICVFQSARDLVGSGASVHVVRDAVCSRSKHNWRAGLDLCARAGASVTVTEAVAFDLLGRAGGDDFKAISRMIR